jgi:hypothetical protein
MKKIPLFITFTSLLFLLSGCNRPADLTGKWKLNLSKTSSSDSLNKWVTHFKDDSSEKMADDFKKLIVSAGYLNESIEIKDNKFLFAGYSCEIVTFSKTGGAKCKDLETNEQKYFGFDVKSNDLYIYLTPTLPPFIYNK